MPFAILGISKQKGGSVGSAGHHVDRTRETPNADPEHSHLNRVVLGEDRNVRELVTEAIDARGGKPRKDSVEAIELLCEASPEFFMDSDPEKYEERVERFTERAVAFLSDPRSGGECVKAVLHLDERTPHIHAHKVPFDPAGNLNARHYLGRREKMAKMHDLYAEYMRPLGLERGREGSRATHQRVKQFYASITKEPKLKIDPEKIPDPSRLKLLTADGVGHQVFDRRVSRVDAEFGVELAGRQAVVLLGEVRAEVDVARLQTVLAQRVHRADDFADFASQPVRGSGWCGCAHLVSSLGDVQSAAGSGTRD